MLSDANLGLEIQDSGEERPGATAAFPYDRLTVERFRTAFPRARWRDHLRAWFVPGTTAERRLNRWLGRELSSALTYADDKGRDAFAFDPIDSPYLEVGEDLRVRTPYSRTIVGELQTVPWAWWDSEIKAWRVPFRSWEALREHWSTIEAAARRNEPAARQARRAARKGSPTYEEMMAHVAEMRSHRYPVPAESLPPLDRIVMTRNGPVIFTDITGEVAEEKILRNRYPDVVAGDRSFIWANWRRPTHDELVKTWPAHRPPSDAEIGRGWWQPTLEELRGERRKAKSIERAQETRRLKRQKPLNTAL
jgi:hypothetical protein